MPCRARHLTVVCAVGALACAGAAQASDPVKVGDQGALGLVGPSTPDLLKNAKADPYAPPGEPVCETARAELDQLSQVLGPDADAPPEKKPAVDPGKMVGGAIKGMIPHRGVLRFLTGAGKKEAALNEAVMAGWARRGYLKGLIKARNCDAPAAPALQQAATAPAPATEPAAPAPQLDLAAAPPASQAAATTLGSDAAATALSSPTTPIDVPAPPAAVAEASPPGQAAIASGSPVPIDGMALTQAVAADPAR